MAEQRSEQNITEIHQLTDMLWDITNDERKQFILDNMSSFKKTITNAESFANVLSFLDDVPDSDTLDILNAFGSNFLKKIISDRYSSETDIGKLSNDHYKKIREILRKEFPHLFITNTPKVSFWDISKKTAISKNNSFSSNVITNIENFNERVPSSLSALNGKSL